MQTFEPLGLSPLIAKIYEAALDRRHWSEFIAMFSMRLNSTGGAIWINDFSERAVEISVTGDSFFTSYGLEQSALESFVGYYGERNVWTQVTEQHVGGQVAAGDRLFPYKRLKNTEWWTDWLRPQDFFYSAGAIVEKEDNRSVNVTVLRPERLGDYNDDEIAVMRALMPHLQTGMALARKLQRLEVLAQTSTEVLNSLPFGVVLLDEQSRILFINSRSHELCKTSKLLQLKENRPMRCTSAADDNHLQHLLSSASLTGSRTTIDQASKIRPNRASRSATHGGVLRLHGLDGTQLQLTVTPLPSWANPFGQRSACAVFINDTNPLVTNICDALRSLYGLTAAEARLTEALVNGCTPQEYATQHELSPHTIRSQLKSITGKVGVSRQIDLVRAVLTGPAVLRMR